MRDRKTFIKSVTYLTQPCFIALKTRLPQFVVSESTFTYFDSTRRYLEKHGKPVAFYSDKHSVFRTNKTGELGGDGVTQFGRALTDLNIDIICANSPQAKGRVERVNQTLQDRVILHKGTKRTEEVSIYY